MIEPKFTVAFESFGVPMYRTGTVNCMGEALYASAAWFNARQWERRDHDHPKSQKRNTAPYLPPHEWGGPKDSDPEIHPYDHKEIDEANNQYWRRFVVTTVKLKEPRRKR